MEEKKYVGVRKKGATWSYRYSIVINGRTITTEQSGFTSAYSAHKAREESIALCKINNGADMNVNLDTIFEKFIATEGNITRSFNTILRYKSLYKNHIQPIFGNGKIGKIRPSQLQTFIAKLSEEYQSEYPRSIYNFLKVLFKFAYSKEYITNNPMDRVEPPQRVGDKKVELLSEENFKKLQNALSTKRVQLPFNIGLALGLRASETYALRWSDFDFTNNEVKITKQLQSRKSVWCIAKPKTRNSIRVIKFGEEFSSYLQAMKRLQEDNKLRYGVMYKSNRVIDTTVRPETPTDIPDFVNVKENGDFMTPNSNKVIARTAKELGFEFNYHMLRHRYCSLLASNSVSPTVIKENAGHSNANFTFSRYIHPTETEKEIACQVIDKSINFIPQTDL